MYKLGDYIPTRDAYGNTLLELGQKNDQIVVFEADIGKSTRSARFGEKFPQRYFNIGVAEQNEMAIAAGAASMRTAYGEALVEIGQKNKDVVILEGECNMYFEEKPERIIEGTFIFVPKGVKHFLETTTNKDLKVFYVFSPPVVQGNYDRK